MKGARSRPKRSLYHTSLVWDGAAGGTQRCEGRPDIELARPGSGGAEDAWSPEHLLVASLESCILLTFLYHARRAGIALVSYESQTEGAAESSAECMEFTEFTVRPRVVIGPAGDVAAAERALRRAADSCLVHRSLRSAVHLDPRIVEAPA